MIMQFQSTHPHGVRRHIGYNIIHFTKVSIHAPTWGATHLCATMVPQGAVSIHAPTWGATVGDSDFGNGVFVSIHAPTWGATTGQSLGEQIKKFQSTHPHGVRRNRHDQTSNS